MVKNIVFSCSYFIDESVWFVNSSSGSKLWVFDSFVCVGGILSDEIFIYKKNPSFKIKDDESVCHINEIIVCCVKCFEFQLSCFSTRDDMTDVFIQIDCHYIDVDYGCFDIDIYIGNEQFEMENLLLDFEKRKEKYFENKRKIKNIFKNKPQTKSCFTYLEKFKYECFCYKCKRIFDIFFVGNLHKISN